MSYFERSGERPRLFYRERGEGTALMLFNGLSQSTANWTSQMSALSERFRVIAWDSRGQGRSELGDDDFTLDIHVADAIELLDHLEVEQAILVGFSHGARVALALAAQHPERTRALCITSIGSDESAYRNLIIRVWSEVLRLGGLEALAWVTTTHILGETFLTAYADHIDVMIDTVQERNSEEGIKRLIESLAQYPPSIDDAQKVTSPACLMTSTNDPLVSEASADRLAETLNPTHRWIFDDCGHTIPVERPDRWRERLFEFLDSVLTND